MNRRHFLFSSAGAMLSAPFMGYASTGSSKIRIGQIGTKHAHASGKIQAIRNQTDSYELLGVVEADTTQRISMTKQPAYQGVTWLTEEQLFNTDGLQAAAIETEVADLVPTASRAIAAGLHIHLDKPGGDSMSAFRRLMEDAEAKNLVVQMGYMLRYNPAFQFMYQAVRDGWLGEIMEIDCMMGKLANPQTREGIGRFPGGGMFELGGHVIDSIVHMLGKPYSVTPYNRNTRSDGVADNQLAVLEYPNAICTVRINHNDPFGSPRRRFQISGNKGTIEIQPLESGHMALFLDEARENYQKGIQPIQMPLPGSRYDGEFADLARVIRGEKPLDWSYQHDLDTHETLLLASGMPT